MLFATRQRLEQLEAAHVRQTQVDDATVEALRAQRREGLASAADGGDFDVLVTEQLHDGRAFPAVVFDDQKPLRVRLDVGLQLVESALELPRRRRLDEIGKSAVR
jgi:hypothetical protein